MRSTAYAFFPHVLLVLPHKHICSDDKRQEVFRLYYERMYIGSPVAEHANKMFLCPAPPTIAVATMNGAGEQNLHATCVAHF